MESSKKELIAMVAFMLHDSTNKLARANKIVDLYIANRETTDAVRAIVDASFHSGMHTSLKSVIKLLLNDECTFSGIVQAIEAEEAERQSLQELLDFSRRTEYKNGVRCHKELCINTSIAVGEKVMMIDDSGFTTIDGQKRYIVHEYDHSKPINQLVGTVKKIHQCVITPSVHDNYYVQDIVIEIEGVLYRNCSKFVTKMK